MLPLLCTCAAATSPASFVKGMQMGINLGNVLDAPTEGAWAMPAQEYYFDDYVQAGFKSVRVPVRWDKHTATASPWLVDPSFMSRVDQVIGWSLDRGLRTILNTHHDDWLDGAMTNSSFDVQLERLVAIWAQVAERFASRSDDLLAFEVYNEPHLNMTVDWLNRMNMAVLPTIRATNPTRNVLFGGLQWMNPSWIVANPDAMLFPSNDSHLFLEVHSYDPYSFCGMTEGTITHEWAPSDVDGWVDSLAAWAAEREMAVLLGEFGCNQTQTNASGRVAWYEYVRRAVQRQGFASTVWDDSGSFAIYDRQVRAWDVDVLHALGLETDAVRSFVDSRTTGNLAASSSQLPPLGWRPSPTSSKHEQLTDETRNKGHEGQASGVEEGGAEPRDSLVEVRGKSSRL
mmetsp:Transcript_40136/g.106168  ORF Transcript_40136/g.106168 Transcript_40136/m.106168 type:complete len:400 (+) Transcript_40136:41-1240(+)